MRYMIERFSVRMHCVLISFPHIYNPNFEWCFIPAEIRDAAVATDEAYVMYVSCDASRSFLFNMNL